jgi:hypothetical protein
MCKEANEEAGIENEQAAAAVSVGVITKMSANSDGSMDSSKGSYQQP